MTEWRRQILAALVEYVHLTTQDFYDLFGVGDEPAERALRRIVHDLVGLGLLKRARLIEDGGAERLPHWEYIHWLSPQGLALARAMGADAEGAGRASEGRSLLMLPHEHDLTRFHMAVNRAAGESVWWRQRDLRDTFAAQAASHTVSPDALFYLGGYYYFLEVERSHQGHYRNGASGLVAKFATYVQYFASQAYRRRWPEMQGFFVLIVTKTDARATGLLEKMRERPCPIFRVASDDACAADVLGPIWRAAGKDGGSSLLQGQAAVGGRNRRLGVSAPFRSLKDSSSYNPDVTWARAASPVPAPSAAGATPAACPPLFQGVCPYACPVRST